VADETDALLREIRDAQRALLDEYRRVANESLAIQREAVEAQRRSIAAQLQHARFYRIAVLALVPVIGVVIWLILRLASRVL